MIRVIGRTHPIPATIEQESFDLVVIGAGYNGTGVARDAAMRGLKVLLLDKGDLACASALDQHQLYTVWKLVSGDFASRPHLYL